MLFLLCHKFRKFLDNSFEFVNSFMDLSLDQLQAQREVMPTVTQAGRSTTMDGSKKNPPDLNKPV